MAHPSDRPLPRSIFILLVALLFAPRLAAQSVPELLDRVRRQYAPDRRVAVFEIEAERVNDTLYVLKGRCDRPEAMQALKAKLTEAGIPAVDYTTSLPSAALGGQTQALVTLSSVNLRTAPDHAAEMSTQAVLGTPLRVLDRQGNWYRVQTPDGYIAWTDHAAIALKTPGQAERWRSADRSVYTAYQGFVYTEPDDRSATLSDIVLGSILETDVQRKANRKFLPVRLPDGREGFIRRSESESLAQWAAEPLDTDRLEHTARSMTGVPYLWGGTSVKGVDCSGMVKTAYFASGVIISRDASQQALTGERIDPSQWRTCEKGDLLFFGNPATGRVTHVAMYLSGGRFIHSAGRVKVNSIDPDAKDYLAMNCLAISRLKNRIGTPGITAVREHSWYFNVR